MKIAPIQVSFKYEINWFSPLINSLVSSRRGVRAVHEADVNAHRLPLAGNPARGPLFLVGLDFAGAEVSNCNRGTWYGVRGAEA